MIAIIPARGGSKGLPGKNIRKLGNKPLIAYTIEAAKSARKIDRVIVTTDSEEIAEIAKMYGAEVLFMRPARLAQDTSSACDVYLHAVDFLKESEGCDIEKFIVLLPTTPFRTGFDIDDAVSMFEDKGADTLVSMTKTEIPVSWYFTVDDQGRTQNAGFASDILANRQNTVPYYRPNGAIYILDYHLLKTKRTYYSNNTVAYVMNHNKSVDIDTLDDFHYAEYLLTVHNEERENLSKLNNNYKRGYVY